MALLLCSTAVATAGADEIVIERSNDLDEWEEASVTGAEITGQGNIRIPVEEDGEFFRIRIRRLEEIPRPTGFVSIPAGVYSRGDHKDDPEVYMERSRPVHEVEVSGFSIGEAPVTYGEWRAVYEWAVENGYDFKNPGQRGSDVDENELPDGEEENEFHPVVYVSWYDAVKWCNAKSEMEGLSPVYFTDEQREAVYRSGEHDVAENEVDWEADGYRLPTEAEWEKAGRGGLDEKRWAWGDEDISIRRANYDGNESGTTIVGSYPPNDYGLYDVAGTVFEWCWDWYDEDWYGQEAARETDTRGPDQGERRVGRGGSWGFAGEFSRVSYRGFASPEAPSYNGGFRIVRSD